MLVTERLEQYIEKHKLCSELLFDNWNEFLELLFSEGGCVKSILWFEYVLISEQKDSLGGGGYKDINNPKYMYAETCIYQEDLNDKSLSDLTEYIQSIQAANHKHKLIPSFFLED